MTNDAFLQATRQNIHPATTLNYEANREMSYDIDRVGLLSKVTLRFSGVLNAKHASKTTFTKAANAPYSIANRLKLVLNNGVSLWDTSGYGAYLQNIINKQNYNLDSIVSGSKVFRFGNVVSSSGTDNNIDFSLDLNVSINDKDLIGLLMLQNNDLVVTLKVTNAPISDLMTDADIDATLTGTWYVSTEYFEVPSSIQAMPVLSYIHCVQEDKINIGSTGETRIAIPRGNTYMRIIDDITLNGAKNCDDVASLSYKYNLHNEPYKVLGADLLALQRMRYGRDLPKGAFVHDFFYQGIPNQGNNRDWIDSSHITEFDQFINIASGATLGTNNNYVSVVREMLMTITTA